MEKNNKKIHLPIDKDDLYLKDHLDTSFDIDNILVSEDLIARTLKKIQESTPQEEMEESLNTKKRFPVRRLVSAAAVAVVLLAGLAIMQNYDLIDDASNKNAESGISEDVVDESGGMTIYNTTMDEGVTDSDSLGSISAAEEDDMTLDNDNADQSTKIAGQNEENIESDSFLMAAEIKFSEINGVSSPDSVVSFTLVKQGENAVELTGEGEEITKFYSLMDEYSLSTSNIQEMDGWLFKAEIVTADKKTITILFDEGIRVSIVDELTDQSTEMYAIVKRDDLIKKIDEYYKRLQ